MARYSWIVPVLLALPALGCGGIQDVSVEEAEQVSIEEVGEARQALVRYCTTNKDCNVYAGCECSPNGVCVPDGFGPPPEGDTCSLPPKRACTTSANCRSGCACMGGYCQASGGGFTDYCAKPLPDAYEADNTATSAKGYMGSPQTGHTFHEASDVDWVVVYFANAAQATFETYDIGADTDTVMELYAYNASTGSAGSLLASNDDKCTVWYDLNCKGSKIVRSVPAQSAFFVRVKTKPEWGPNVYSSTAPGYSLRIF